MRHTSTSVAMRHDGYIMRQTRIAVELTLLACISPLIRAQSVHDAAAVEAVRAINQEADRLDTELKGQGRLGCSLSQNEIRGVADAPVLADWAEKVHALAVIEGISRPGGILHTGPLGLPGRDFSIPILDMPELQRQQLNAW